MDKFPKRKKLGFTGTRKGMTDKQKKLVRLFVENLGPVEVHHGDCVGADSDFADITESLKVVIHPPTNSSHRAWCCADIKRPPKPYIERNHDIVDDTDCLIATPDSFEEVLRSGTWATIRWAQKQKKPILIVYPNGKTELQYNHMRKKTAKCEQCECKDSPDNHVTLEAHPYALEICGDDTPVWLCDDCRWSACQDI
jgi:hypothetical protein